MNARPDTAALPRTEYAVELVGPDRLRLNTAKKVAPPGPHRILARVEAVGLCFSDLKLLKLFDRHPRKSEIISGIPEEVLAEMPGYVPGTKRTVPG
ncbi:MAG: alcohol dehydrogenase, partial [Planctomycetes bacterium]|nr:alcohol dehydrogenase [Planctomycetota bacterium]